MGIGFNNTLNLAISYHYVLKMIAQIELFERIKSN